MTEKSALSRYEIGKRCNTHLPLLLWHDYNAQWFDTSATSTKLGGIGGQHLTKRFLLPELLDQHVGPSTSQDIPHL